MTARHPLLGPIPGGGPWGKGQGQAALVWWASLMTLANVGLVCLVLGGAGRGGLFSSSQDTQPPPALEQCTQSAFEVVGYNSSWYTMKRTPPPAHCRVGGIVVDALEPEYNYRRGWALGYSNSPKDRSHLVPYFRAFQDRTMASKKRRVLLCMGIQKWENLEWLLHWYPLDFSEVHVMEEKRGRFIKPPPSGKVFEGLLGTMNAQSQVAGAGSLPVPDWVLGRIQFYHYLIRTNDTEAPDTSQLPAVNISRIMYENLKLTPEDAVVVVMDIEHAEWEVLPVWMQDPLMPRVVDELFLQVHYQHPTMKSFQWSDGHTRDEANRLYLQLRFKGFLVHPWT